MPLAKFEQGVGPILAKNAPFDSARMSGAWMDRYGGSCLWGGAILSCTAKKPRQWRCGLYIWRMPVLSDLLPILHSVQAASQAALAIYRSAFAVQLKDDRTPVTEADLAADRILRQDLAHSFPGVPVVTEESDAPFTAGHAPRAYFLVDPIDGTSDFVMRRDEFTVNVAYIEDGLPVLGVVSAPALGVLYAGIHGLGAWKMPLDGPWFVEGVAAPQTVELRLPSPHFTPGVAWNAPVRVLASVSHGDAATDALIAAIPGVVRVQVGSSLKFCHVAEGEADYYPRCISLNEWDIAAGHAVLRAAGGGVYRVSTTEQVRYGNPGFKVPAFEAY